MDCLRADHVGFLGYQRPTTPFLDSLAKESFVVPNAIVGGVPTFFSFPTIMASRYPLALGRDVVGIAPGETTLASHLRSCGYATAGFVAANPYVSWKFGYEQGFDFFCDFLRDDSGSSHSQVYSSNGSNRLLARVNRVVERVSRTLGPVARVYDELYFQYLQHVRAESSLDALRPFPSAETLVSEALKWLDATSPDPFFLWLHLMDPHAPHYPSREALQALGSSSMTDADIRYLNTYWNRRELGESQLRKKRDAIVELYDGGIRWVDSQMERLVQALKQQRIWDHCVFAFTADHGEEFLEHGDRFHAPWTMKEELIRVPLLVRVPKGESRRTNAAPFSLIDLAPTLLEGMGSPIPEQFQGRSLWRHWQSGNDWNNPPIVESTTCFNPNERKARKASRVLCVRDWRFKLIVNFGSGEEEFFDLQADPNEKTSLGNYAEPLARRRLLEFAYRHLAGSQNRFDDTAKLRSRLKDIASILSGVPVATFAGD